MEVVVLMLSQFIETVTSMLSQFVETVIKPYHEIITAVATAVLAVYTIILARIARRQNRDARIVQRAYVRVGPGDIRTNSGGEYVGHVLIENVGQLPATKFTWRFETIHVADGDWQTPLLKRSRFRYGNVLPIRLQIVRGSKGISRQPIDACLAKPKFLYVWGRVEYDDGFGVSRFTNFCYRYNWENERAIPNGEGRRHIPGEDGRYHVYGNDAN